MEPLTRSSLEASAGLILALVLAALTASGVAVSGPLAVLLWVVAAGILVDVVLRWPLASGRLRWVLAGGVVTVVALVAVFAYRYGSKPMTASDIASEVVRQLGPLTPKPTNEADRKAFDLPATGPMPPPQTPRQTPQPPKPGTERPAKRNEPTPRGVESRVRIVHVLVLSPGAVAFPPGIEPFPAINIYYDNAGTAPASSIVNHYAVGFTNGHLESSKIAEIQDDLLRWEGWHDAMAKRAQHQMYPGDPGEFTTIPSEYDGSLAQDFRNTWNDVAIGKAVLYVFVAFKYHDAKRPEVTAVTEDCFWFSAGFARHNCGRSRSFVQEPSATSAAR